MYKCPQCKETVRIMQFLTFKQCLKCGKTFNILHKIKCPDCDGTGLHYIENDPTTETDCQYCKGTGERYND